MLCCRSLKLYDKLDVDVFTIVDENDDEVDTCNVYPVAPVDEFQATVGLMLTPSLPSAGLDNVGGPSIVVKLRTSDQSLSFDETSHALTRQ